MRARVWIWLLACLLCLAGVWLFWRQPVNSRAKSPALPAVAVTPAATVRSASTATNNVSAVSTNGTAAAKTNQFAWRLNNTTKSLDQLAGDRHAILLENALIDTSEPLNLSIPAHLRSSGDPGAYIVQARGPIGSAFRALLARSGVQIIAYIPNNAYLVRASQGGANGLAGNPLTQAVVPYEPYYKISSSMPVMVGQKSLSSVPMGTNRVAGPSLLVFAVKQAPLPAGTSLTLGLFNDDAAATVAQIEKLGGQVVARDGSPFGPVVRVQPPTDWIALAALPGVQIVEPYYQRQHANDLSRVTTGVATDTQVSSNYMNLTGSNVMVEVNDTGIDAKHPDFGTGSGLPVRVFGDSANLFINTLVDTDGHGTHVAGTIAGNGFESLTVTNAQGSIMPATNGQFRGMAPLANLLSMDLEDADQTLQEAAAQTNALISNNSWNYGDASYDLAAASYDAAVRDALSEVTGSQPVLFVFSAGNAGGGGNDGGGGTPDTILSPATAKNVITVGAIEELRNITNVVTDISSNQSAVWNPWTDSSFQVAGFSSRGNVGIGTEGTAGRYKPDVVAPGTFVISTRSEQWNEQAYYNPTNYTFADFIEQTVAPQTLNYYNIFVPGNAVGVVIQIVPNLLSTSPFPTNLPIYVELADLPTTNTFDFLTWNNQVSIPPDNGRAIANIQSIQNIGFWYAIGNTNNDPVNYDIITEIITTNDLGNYFQVLSNLNNSLGGSPDSTVPPHYYRYETGTSMSAADVSGVLALMQDYFTNTLKATPSPALLKALVINGARADGNYDFQVQNPINYQGWGLVNLSNSLPPGITNVMGAAGESMFFLDQSPNSALATGDSHTYNVALTTNALATLPLRITLAWTDPPGDPAAAIKLVNDLNLVVSNSTSGAVYYGNDIPASSIYNQAENPTNPPAYDSINNVENVYLPPGVGTNFTIIVQGFRVNVNAVTAHPNNVVQDYALVISSGNGEVTNAFTMTDMGIISNPTTDQQITTVITTNAPLLNQFVGASTPLLGTSQILLTTNGTELNGIQLGGTNIVTLGMTNQWHFYVVHNTGTNSDFTNAAFITFIPDTLSVPRLGVFANPANNNSGPYGNVTRPEADIDLYVSTNPALTNLDPNVIFNADKSVGRGGTEFVAYSNSTPGQVYYVGVYSEDQMASEYGFIPIFTDIPFSQPGPNGSQIVNGLNVPVNIPDGSTAHPGIGYVFALMLTPMETKRVVVTDSIQHENFGDLIGTFAHGQQNGLSDTVVLNNHDSVFNLSGIYTNTYDDSGFGDILGTRRSDGPGNLNSFVGQQAVGPWILAESDTSLTQTGSVQGLSVRIDPHQDLTKGIIAQLGPLGWFYDFIDVPSGVTSMTVLATNLPPHTGLVDLYAKFGAIPTLTDTNEFGPAGLTNITPVGLTNSITINSPAPGRYWIGLYNNSVLPQTVGLGVILARPVVPGETIYTSGGEVPLRDDAVTTDSIFVPANQTISSMEVGLRVDHPRISDLVFHLISPSGTRVLLVENRGGNTANMGGTINATNVVPVTSSGNGSPSTTVINLAINTGTLSIFYNFYGIPDEMVIHDQSGALIFDSGQVSGSGVFNVGYTNSSFVTITMNPVINEGQGDLWDYTVNALQSLQTYLVLTEDTNKTTTPIKFAPPPFTPNIVLTTNPPAWHGSFEGLATADITAGNYYGGWYVNAGSIDVYQNGSPSGSYADEGTNWLDLDGFQPGTISTNIPTVAGKNYTLAFTYSRNPDGINLAGYKTAVMQVFQNTNSLLVITNNITNQWTSLGWATTSVVFTATSNLTKISFQSLDPGSDIYGMFLDCVDLTSSDLNDGFENTIATNYVRGINPGFGGWAVTTNQVTVISNASLAYQGTNLLALADGQIYRALPTIPGTTYTLSFAYRGPGAVALWRGESNTVDSIAGHNGNLATSVSYVPGEVNEAFNFNGSPQSLLVPYTPTLVAANYSVDTWIKPTGPVTDGQDAILEEPNGAPQLVVRTGTGTSVQVVFFFAAPGGFPTYEIASTTNIPINVYTHLAGTWDGTALRLYINGVLNKTSLPGASPTFDGVPFCIGGLNDPGDGFVGQFFHGTIDELTYYGRAVSDSEIQAIYNLGSAGLTKFDTNSPSVAQGLAEAFVTLNGTNQPSFPGNNTNWQTISYSFVATSTNTPLIITGIEPGMLLDNFVMTTIPTNNYDLYYQPEQSLDTVQGENALGQWQLEVQDDRAGANLPVPSLLSWQLRFNFPFTPPTITTITNTQVITNNLIPPGGIAYYLVIVPTNADISTNILLNTTGPLNLIFDAANPPTGILPPDYLILSTPTTISNSAVLYTNASYFPTNFASGGTYYLGVQNLNAFAVNYAIAVNFHLVAPLALPQLPELLAIANQLFTVTNSGIGGNPPLTYTLTTSVPTGPPPPDVDVNGVITWTPIISQAPLVYTFTNIVTDSTLPTPQTATNIFHVLVVLTNGLPTFPGAEGAGGFAIGGRGGDVYHVVNVNDDGPGSLRFGISSTFGSRTIVFDVSGTINLFSPLKISDPYFTIAGQTAPGDGITIQGLTFSAETVHGAVDSAHDEILRYLRCRPGDIYSPFFQGDSFHFLGATNSIADHLSASWSINTVLSTMLSTNITVQWSMIAESLDHSAHLRDDGNPGFQENGDGSLIRFGSGAISYHHNLYADNFSQNPRVGDNIRLDFINNVVCNWGGAAGLNADDTADNPAGYANLLNYRGNYFIAGSNSANASIAFASGVPNAAFAQIYEATNLIDSNAATNFLDGLDNGFGIFTGNYTQLGSPVPMPEIGVSTNSPELAYEQVLAFAGATVAGATAAGTPAYGTSLLRDPVDTNIVINVRNKSGQVIDFISPTNFPGVYFITNSGTTYSNYTGAGSYWVSQGVTKFVGVNPWPVLASAPQPLDSDGDGLPDYWEMTFEALGQVSMNPGVPNNNHSNPDGYTDLEDYLNWLAGPHALTVSNTPVAVDLYAIVGRTGNLIFSVGNPTNGTVTLTNAIATFTPSNTFFGFASFGFTVTNLNTGMGGTNLDNGFDVTVSVMVSMTNIVTSSLPITNAVPSTNTVLAGGIVYYLIDVPINAQLATNILSAATGPLNLIFSQTGFPTGTNTGDYFLLTNTTGGISLLSTNSNPTNIVPGGSYYLGVQNLGGAPVNFGLEVDFYPPPPIPPGPPPPAVPIIISSITHTNNGFLITWFAPTNDVFQVQWTGSITPLVNWQTFTNIIPYTGPVTTTNGLFSFFDDGSQTSGFGLERFYRLILLGSGPGLTNGVSQTNSISPGGTAFLLVSVPTNAISANNVLISATGPVNVFFNQAHPPTDNTNAGDFLELPTATTGSFLLTTSSVPPLVPGANYYLGIQNPGAGSVTFDFQVTLGFAAPGAAVSNFGITATNGGIWLKWNGQTSYQYQIQWTTNLQPPTAWNTISNIVLTSTTGVFTFYDDGSLTGGFGPRKFFRLIAYPYLTPIPQTLSISSVTVTSFGGTNDLMLRWSAPTNYHYGIQWTTNLSLPYSNWSVIASPVLTLTNGVYTFIDSGQTGPPATAKFFRLLEY